MRWALLLALCAVLGACAGGTGPFGRSEALRISEVESEDDPTRRASLRLCVQGLDADVAGQSRAARSHYERAIQIDPTNPYAYLALARHELETGDPRRSLEYLDQAQTLLESEGALSPRVEPHLAGLRGAALDRTRGGGAVYLSEASRLSPEVWSDGQLSASELR